jgi:hypothetical protein
MKPYALTLLIILLVGFSCRSSRNSLDTSVRENSQEDTKISEVQNIQNQTSVDEAHHSRAEETIEEVTTTITFDASGNVQSIQETKRRTGRTKLENGTRSESNVSGISTSKNTYSIKKRTTDFSQKQLKYSDGRIVQGWQEWGIVALVAAVVLLIIFFTYAKKRNR